MKPSDRKEIFSVYLVTGVPSPLADIHYVFIFMSSLLYKQSKRNEINYVKAEVKFDSSKDVWPHMVSKILKHSNGRLCFMARTHKMVLCIFIMSKPYFQSM